MDATSATGEKTAIVDQEVHQLLQSAPAFLSLTPEKQEQVQNDTAKVARFLADMGIADQVGLMPQASRPAVAQPFQAGRGRGQPSTPLGQAGADLANVVKAVDFPGFVGDLIKGVFNAVVDASIQQMEAYSELVANVAKSVDDYMRDNVSDDQARDYLASQYPDQIEPDLQAGRLKPKVDAPEDSGGFLQELGLPFDLQDMDDEDAEREVVTAARRKISMDRQQLLATMVMMGLNRIVVTDGNIKAGVVFDLDAETLQKRHFDRQTGFESNSTTTRSTKSGGWFKPRRRSTFENTLNVTTDTNMSADSERSAEMKVKMTGNVDLRFKSDYFPLERMTELMGVNQDAVSRAANPSGGGSSSSRAPAPSVTPPPPPPLPGA